MRQPPIVLYVDERSLPYPGKTLKTCSSSLSSSGLSNVHLLRVRFRSSSIEIKRLEVVFKH